MEIYTESKYKQMYRKSNKNWNIKFKIVLCRRFRLRIEYEFCAEVNTKSFSRFTGLFSWEPFGICRWNRSFIETDEEALRQQKIDASRWFSGLHNDTLDGAWQLPGQTRFRHLCIHKTRSAFSLKSNTYSSEWAYTIIIIFLLQPLQCVSKALLNLHWLTTRLQTFT